MLHLLVGQSLLRKMISRLVGPSRTLHLLNLDSGTRDAMSYMQKKLPDKNIQDNTLNILYASYSSFKVIIAQQLQNVVLNENFWPDGSVELFRFRRKQNYRFVRKQKEVLRFLIKTIPIIRC